MLYFQNNTGELVTNDILNMTSTLDVNLNKLLKMAALFSESKH